MTVSRTPYSNQNQVENAIKQATTERKARIKTHVKTFWGYNGEDFSRQLEQFLNDGWQVMDTGAKAAQYNGAFNLVFYAIVTKKTGWE